MLETTFHETEDLCLSGPGGQILELLTTEEALVRCKNFPFYSNLKRRLEVTAEYCEAEILPECVTGTLLTPDKQNPRLDQLSLTYYLDSHHLLLIAAPEFFPALADTVEQAHLLECTGIFQIFYGLLEYLIQVDMALLRAYEKRLAVMEAKAETVFPGELQREITDSRRSLLRFLSVYQQLNDMCVILTEDSANLLSAEYRQHLARLQAHIDRLYDHTRILREYALQIREFHQAQLDLKQNDTMRILTVVTTLFMPLTLLTGWYGMNFSYMPELMHPFSYFILIALCLLIVGGEIWFFKKKGWL